MLLAGQNLGLGHYFSLALLAFTGTSSSSFSVEPSKLGSTAAAAGFAPVTSEIIELASGKRFCLQTFRLESR